MPYYQTKVFFLTNKCQNSKTTKPSLQLILYGRSEDLGVIQVIFDNVPAIIAVQQEQHLPHLPNMTTTRDLNINSFDNNKPLKGLYFNNLQDWYQAQEILKNDNINFYQTDMLPTERFLAEKFINCQGKISGEAQQNEDYLSFLNPNLTVDDCQVNLKVLSLDIETGVKTNQIYSIAGHLCGLGGEYQRIFVLNNEEKVINHRLSYHHTEVSLLKAFLKWFCKVDPDIIIGWYVIGFDFLFLEEKYRQFHLPFNIGRDKTPPLFTKLSQNLTVADISGRVIIDGIDYFRKLDKKFDNYKLETIAQKYLGIGKNISPEQDKIKQIEHLFHNDKEQLAQYNIVDCILVSKIFAQLKILDYYIYVAKLTGVMIHKQNIENLSFKKLYTPYLHQAAYSSPMANKSDSTGKFPFEIKIAEKKIYSNVIELKINNFLINICHKLKLDPTNNKPMKQQQILTQILKKINHFNSQKNNDKTLQLASRDVQKNLVEQLLNFNNIFFDVNIAKKIADFIKDILNKIERYLQQNNKGFVHATYQKIYIYDVAEDKITHLINQIKKIINKYIKIDINIENYFNIFVNYSEEKKVKYYGILANQQTQLVGFNTNKRSLYNLITYLQQQALTKIANNQDCQTWIRQFIEKLKKGHFDDKLFYHRTITKKPHEYKKHLPAEIIAAKQLKEIPLNVSYIFTEKGVKEKQIYNNEQIDYQYYINHHIKPLIDNLFSVIDSNYQKSINDIQIHLFD